MSENKIPTIKEIARQLNVSISTVSRALHNHNSIGLRTRMRIHQLAEELNYEPNQMAISFKQRKTYTIGVVLPNLRELFFSEAISGIEDIAATNKYNVLIGQSHDDPEREKQIVTAMKNQRVDGIIASLSKYTKSIDHFTALNKYNIPVVFFDRVPSSPNVNKVAFDMNSGTREALQYIINLGHKRIGVINGPEEMKSSKERTEVYMEALQKRKIKIDLSLVISTDLTKEGTKAAMDQLLNAKPRPTAILAINDWVALDAIQYAKSLGIKINKEICFVSYANLPITSYLETPPMASVEQYPYEQGKKASEILMDLLHQHNELPEQSSYKNFLIKGGLVVHEKN
jgi:DNA-binding LacI/PurR family transcriptional regulator